MILGQYIWTSENPYTGEAQTFLLTATTSEELQPQYCLETLEGEYKTPRRFNEAAEKTGEGKTIYNIVGFWGASVDELIEKLGKLRKMTDEIVAKMGAAP